MAFSEKELQIIEWAKQNNKSAAETQDAILRFRRTGSPSKPEESGLLSRIVSDIPSDIKETAVGIGETIGKGADVIQEAKQDLITGQQGRFRTFLQTFGRGTRTAADVIGQTFTGSLKLPFTQKFEERAKERIEKIAKPVIESEPVRQALEKYESLSPQAKRDFDIVIGPLLLGTELVGAGQTLNELKTAVRQVKRGVLLLDDVATNAISKLKPLEIPEVGSPSSLFKEMPNSIDDVVKNIDTLKGGVNSQIDIDNTSKRIESLINQGKTAEARALAEELSPNISFSEKVVNLRPDIKQRIQGKQDLMREYFDVTHARNVNDRLPSIQEYSGNYARKAADTMQEKLRETGGEIGQVRNRLGTIKAPIESVNTVSNSFIKELDRLNLRISNGQIVGKSGSVRGVSDAELKILQDFYSDLNTVKQSPTLKNIIDLRTKFDGTINFERTRGSGTNALDSLALTMRSELKNASEKIVGKSAASDVTKYSDFMSAFNDLSSYTNRRAGGEYLLRLILSGRGGEARQIVQTIKDYTGIDLLDHATMMQIATEVIANDAQKNLFRQEIQKAGLDAAKLIKGDPTGAALSLFEQSKDFLFNPEKIFLEASK